MTEDWVDLLAALQAEGARFLVVGAHALAVHGVTRATQDIDVWVDPSDENAERVWRALLAFGAPLAELGIGLDDLTRPETVIQIGLPPNRVDILTSITGVSEFADAWRDRLDSDVDRMVMPFLGRETLIRNKRSTGRLKDLADVEALGRAE